MLKQLAKSLYRSALDEAGIPATMAAVLQAHPALLKADFLEKKTASSNDIHRWDGLGASARGFDGQQGILLGWADALGSYQSIDLPVPALKSLVTSKRIDSFSCDIADIETLSGGKSSLTDFENLDDFARQRCADKIADVSKQGLMKNLQHDQIRILGPNPSDSLSRFAWDDRINLLNDGGAHHFAAARYIAKTTGISVPITARLHEYALSAVAANELTGQFDIFAIGDPSSDPRAGLAMQDAFKSLRATFFIGSMPWSPNTHTREASAVFLPKSDAKSQRVAKLFRKEGMMDLGALLEEKLEHQRSFKRSQQYATELSK